MNLPGPGSKAFFKEFFKIFTRRLIEARLHLRWSMLNRKSRSRSQSLLPLPDLSRKIEGDSARRVILTNFDRMFKLKLIETYKSLYLKKQSASSCN